jgi:NADH:quinone reductase (non-electrogenic)
MAAALMLGAEGVMMASRFIATSECQVHDNIKHEVVKRQENETTLICKSINLQGRAIKNKVVGEILEAESRGADLMELAKLVTGERCRQAWISGDTDVAPMMMGQSIGRIYDVVSCKKLLDRMVKEARKEAERLTEIF